LILKTPVDSHERVEQKYFEELNAKPVSLVADGPKLLVGALRRMRSISGPELTK
tara:strand:+ start:137 stop:298 length:162 start_codon:yes stop_codon:yes gene_type:complete